MAELLCDLEGLVAELTVVDPVDLGGFAAVEAAVRVHRAGDRLRAQQVGWLGRVEADAAWVGTGARTFTTWVGRALEVPHTEAQRLTRLATVFRDTLPATAAAVRAGEVSTAKGWLIAATATTPERITALREVPLVDEQDGDGHLDGTDDTSDASDASGPGGPAPRDPLAGCTGEEVLLALAAGYGVGEFAKVTRRFAHVADPDADERGYRAALAREFFDLAATTGGYHVSGFLTRDHGQALKTALRAITGVPAKGDTRTASQRRAGALTGLARTHLDHGHSGKVATVRPHLSVHVTHTELDDLLHRTGACTPNTSGNTGTDTNADTGTGTATATGTGTATATGTGTGTGTNAGTGAATDGGERASRCSHGSDGRSGVGLATLLTAPPAEWEDGTGPIPDSVLARLAADCEVTRVVFGPTSQILNVGRTQRTFTGHLRRAVIARDRACVIDDCGAPAFMDQIHHAKTRWADGGTTNVTNAALVCAFHNQWLEDHHVPMRRITAPDGTTRWQTGTPGTYTPDGTGHFPEPATLDEIPKPDETPKPEQAPKPKEIPKNDTF